ncbi:MAG: hypothetical protein J6S96_00440 [Muribaculaceae bacterium]|nr:hypothetical protein [Muribaculaceae bacterium]
MNLKTKNITLIIILLLSAICASATVYHESTNKVMNFDYSHFTYSYIENGVEKTAKLTDEAKSAEQIAALLKEVYVNPDIPGIHYAYDFNGMQSRKIDYNNYGHLVSGGAGYDWQQVNAGEFFPNPKQDGMTLIMLTISDTWKASLANNTTPLEYIRRCYTSAKLMTHFTRVNDSSNPGYIIAADSITTNRFFFISKGKPRSSYTRPLYRLYEQISPVKGDNGHNTDDFIDEIKAGHSYLCYHDCTDVGTIGGNTNNHWFTISKNGENYHLNNLVIFIPDRRFEGEHDPEGVHADTEINTNRLFKNYGNSESDNQDDWNKEVMPKVLSYTADLNAQAIPAEETGYYNVKLNWSTSFTKENLGVDVPQHFYVYIIDGNKRIQLASIEDQPTMAREHIYRVKQITDPQTFSYVITAHPINYDNNNNIQIDTDGNPVITISAESPVRTVTIPGLHSAFFTQAQEYRCRFDAKGVNSQNNVYKNKMTIHPNSYEDYLSIKNNLEAYDVIRTDANNNKVVVAQVQFIPIDGTMEYDYTVTYNAATQVTNQVFDDEEPSTNGRLTGFDNSTVTVIDRFIASTKENNHPDKYTYTFEQLQDGEYKNYSNSFTVPVFKTTSEVGGQEHTFNEIVADTNHSAKAIPSNFITFNAISDPTVNLSEYAIYRADYQLRKMTKIGKAEHVNNYDKYNIYSISEDGMINEFLGSTNITDEDQNITVLDYNNINYNQQSLYVPVITTLSNGDINKKNTYGCDFKTMYYPQLDIEVMYQEKSNPFSTAEGVRRGYATMLKLTPKIPNQSKLNVYYYRVWRVVDEGDVHTETLLNTLDDLSAEFWSTQYYPIKEVFPGSEPIVINDIFIDSPDISEKNVSYIARLYATCLDENETPILVEGSRASNNIGDGKDFFITENKLPTLFWESVVTSINDLNDNAHVESVTYYNVMGIPSSKPYQGINIVMTRYSNGIITSEKTIK